MTATDELIPVFTGKIANQPLPLCNAQRLHSFLEVQTRFADWIKRRIEEYGFVENQDFVIDFSSLRNQNDSSFQGNQKGRGGDRRSREYHLTLDMAKEVSMVERTEKGREVRRYFIECERKLLGESVTASGTISPAQQHELQVIAARRSQDSGKLRAEIWSRFDNHFRIAKYSQLPTSKFEEAKSYLETLQLRTQEATSFRIDSVTIECLPVLPKENTTFSRKYGEAVLSALRVWSRESCSAPVSMEVIRGLDALERVMTRAATEMDEAALHLALAGKYLDRWRRSETKESPRELPTGKTPTPAEKRGSTVGDPLVGVDLPLSTWKNIFRRLGTEAEMSSRNIERRLREFV